LVCFSRAFRTRSMRSSMQTPALSKCRGLRSNSLQDEFCLILREKMRLLLYLCDTDEPREVLPAILGPSS
jgi:hypothetical protein